MTRLRCWCSPSTQVLTAGTLPQVSSCQLAAFITTCCEACVPLDWSAMTQVLIRKHVLSCLPVCQHQDLCHGMCCVNRANIAKSEPHVSSGYLQCCTTASGMLSAPGGGACTVDRAQAAASQAPRTMKLRSPTKVLENGVLLY